MANSKRKRKIDLYEMEALLSFHTIKVQ